MIEKLAELALAAASARAVTRTVKRKTREVAIKAVAVAIATVGVAFLLSALWIELTILYDPLFASLWIGLALLLLAILVAVIGLALIRQVEPPPPAMPDISTLMKDFSSEIDFNFDRKGTPTKTVGAALAAGFAIGRMFSRA